MGFFVMNCGYYIIILLYYYSIKMGIDELGNHLYGEWLQNISKSVKEILRWLSSEQRREMLKLLQEESETQDFRDPEYSYDSEFTCFWTIHYWMWEEEYDEYYATSDEKAEDDEFWVETLPDWLSEYRNLWKQKIRWISPEAKEKIIKAWESIKCEFDDLKNWWRMVTLMFGKHWSKMMFSEFPLNADNVLEEYSEKEPNPVTWGESINVNLAWIKWPNLDNWEDYKVRSYIGNYWMPTIEWVRSTLYILWKYAGLYEEREQIALMMYLTGMEWTYWLEEWDATDLVSSKKYTWHRTFLVCDPNVRGFGDYFYEDGNNALNGKLFYINWILWK